MKRRNIFFGLAFILAIGSAFTTKPAASRPLTSTPGYIKPSCNTIVILCDEVPNFACTLPSGAQTYKDKFTCVVPLTRSTLH